MLGWTSSNLPVSVICHDFCHACLRMFRMEGSQFCFRVAFYHRLLASPKHWTKGTSHLLLPGHWPYLVWSPPRDLAGVLRTPASFSAVLADSHNLPSRAPKWVPWILCARFCLCTFSPSARFTCDVIGCSKATGWPETVLYYRLFNCFSQKLSRFTSRTIGCQIQFKNSRATLKFFASYSVILN